MIIKDLITGKGEHNINVVFPLHPSVNVASIDEARATLEVSSKNINFGFEGAGLLELANSTYHPEFGLSIENQKLLYRLTGLLPLEITTIICW